MKKHTKKKTRKKEKLNKEGEVIAKWEVGTASSIEEGIMNLMAELNEKILKEEENKNKK